MDTLRTKVIELKYTITEIKNSIDLIADQNVAKERICELEERKEKNIQTEAKRQKNKKYRKQHRRQM